MMYRQAFKTILYLILVFVFSYALSNTQDVVRVKRVVDGDTILLTNGERVRLIGVDTPETKHPQKPVQRFGKEAYLFTKGMVEGKQVRLEYEGREETNMVAFLPMFISWMGLS